jgi:hypothetical protein
MTGGPGLAARATGRGRRCWTERAEGESWAAALGPVRERVGRAGRGKEGVGRLGCWRWTVPADWAECWEKEGSGLGWIWFSYFSGFPFLSFSNSLKLI